MLVRVTHKPTGRCHEGQQRYVTCKFHLFSWLFFVFAVGSGKRPDTLLFLVRPGGAETGRTGHQPSVSFVTGVLREFSGVGVADSLRNGPQHMKILDEVARLKLAAFTRSISLPVRTA